LKPGTFLIYGYDHLKQGNHNARSPDAHKQ
jgi:hypothetical protein